MKKILGVVLTVVMLVVTLISFSACNDKKKDDGAKNSIVGSWKYESGDYTYTFNEDGTGKYAFGTTALEFTYEIKDGNKISILYKGNTVALETEYKIDGDTLNVIDSLGHDTIYKKVK